MVVQLDTLLPQAQGSVNENKKGEWILGDNKKFNPFS